MVVSCIWWLKKLWRSGFNSAGPGHKARNGCKGCLVEKHGFYAVDHSLMLT